MIFSGISFQTVEKLMFYYIKNCDYIQASVFLKKKSTTFICPRFFPIRIKNLQFLNFKIDLRSNSSLKRNVLYLFQEKKSFNFHVLIKEPYLNKSPCKSIFRFKRINGKRITEFNDIQMEFSYMLLNIENYILFFPYLYSSFLWI